MRDGIRQDPRTASLTHGRHAKPETLAALAAMEGDLAKREDGYLDGPGGELRNHDRLLARLWAVCDILAEKKPEATGEFRDRPPPLLAALNSIAATLEKVARIEAKIREDAGTFSLRQVEAWMGLVVTVLREFVPEDRVEGALDRIEDLTREMEQPRSGA